MNNVIPINLIIYNNKSHFIWGKKEGHENLFQPLTLIQAQSQNIVTLGVRTFTYKFGG